MGTSMIAGPFGAWMLRRFSWHSVFLLESALTVVGIGLVLFSFAVISSRPEYSHSPLLEKGHSRMPRIDLEGWVLLLLAVAIPLVAVTLGDNFLDWAHPIEITLLICSPLFISFFVLFEAKVARVPIVNMQPVFEAKYLRVLFQVFGVIMILNSVRLTQPLRETSSR
ncbi:hypothetical protein M406DRAFT_254562 [Cryphonectria parasitica EP155]|uniref:Major facilitator superfamily (MFS) profile domain-containing protein n=1 Tax=Cryphonectria parasitica (strain ATCC 38755 / EP155) TaxID=660469 RepID=A0A9P5CS17_CRYP1|nr:uncharacterized protein M406DRAFT_254562 [Cryphonectria parasitica EP155]KAF3768122.1 hypothetical protein M406DRAFT_254562 [Cryphonectria parasitica EP155]